MAIVWRELNPSAPSYLIAGRTDTPPDGAGDAFAAVVQWGSATLNQWSLQRRIERELAAQRTFAESICPAAGAGGVLAVVLVDHRRVGEMEGDTFLSCFVEGAYQRPEHGVWRYSHASRLEAAGGGETRRIYFWGTRT